MHGSAGSRDEITTLAARMVAEEGLDFGSAKRRAARDLGLGRRAPLPDNLALEDAVREHLALFQAESQPAELLALRQLALQWMQRLELFRPHLSGAVWHGTATRLNDIGIDLYCDDPKMVELALIDQRVRYEQGGGTGRDGEPVNILSLQVRCTPLDSLVGIHLRVLEHDQLRGALRLDARGRAQRGDATAVRSLLDASPTS